MPTLAKSLHERGSNQRSLAYYQIFDASLAHQSLSRITSHVKQPLTEVRGFILRSKQTLQNSPNMPELYTKAEAPGPTYFLVGLHRLLDRAERVNVLCRTSTTGRLAPTIPRYSAVPPCVDRDTRDGQDCSAIPPLTEVRGFLAEMSMNRRTPTSSTTPLTMTSA